MCLVDHYFAKKPEDKREFKGVFFAFKTVFFCFKLQLAKIWLIPREHLSHLTQCRVQVFFFPARTQNWRHVIHQSRENYQSI